MSEPKRGLVERLADKADHEEAGGWPEDRARWWMLAIAEELEAQAATCAGCSWSFGYDHAAAYLREQAEGGRE